MQSSRKWSLYLVAFFTCNGFSRGGFTSSPSLQFSYGTHARVSVCASNNKITYLTYFWLASKSSRNWNLHFHAEYFTLTVMKLMQTDADCICSRLPCVERFFHTTYSIDTIQHTSTMSSVNSAKRHRCS